MRVVIVGGGKLGYYLSQSMMERKYNISLIEKNKSRCLNLANNLETEVIHGDGTEIEVLISAGIAKADCFVAATGRDQDNLVACQLVKRKFMIEKVIARVNNPRNLVVMEELGIYNTVSSTEIITKMVEHEIHNEGMQLIASLNKGKAFILSIILREKFSMKNTKIKDWDLPPSCFIVSAIRKGSFVSTQDDAVLLPGDEIIIFCEYNKLKEAKAFFGCGPN
ncbi:MAG: NAD-binding protein [Oscillospiraceae bacterium]|nr:NAD-binding protein [Oscillospiraceae bacterium]